MTEDPNRIQGETFEPEPCARCGSTIERRDLRHSLVEKMHYNCALAYLEDERNKLKARNQFVIGLGLRSHGDPDRDRWPPAKAAEGKYAAIRVGRCKPYCIMPVRAGNWNEECLLCGQSAAFGESYEFVDYPSPWVDLGNLSDLDEKIADTDPRDWSKPSRAVIAFDGRHGIVIWFVGAHIEAMKEQIGGSDIEELGFSADPFHAGIWVWEGGIIGGHYNSHTGDYDDGELRGKYRDPDETEWQAIMRGDCPWDPDAWLLPGRCGRCGGSKVEQHCVLEAPDVG